MNKNKQYRNIEDAISNESDRNSKMIVIGHEGCWNKIPSQENVKKLRALNPNKKIHLMTPLATQKNLANTISRIDALIGLVDSLSFNDYGTMNYFTQKYADKKKEFYLGRLLTKSFSDCPWSEKIIVDETDLTKNYMRSLTVNDIRKLEFYKDRGITGIEVSFKMKENDIEAIRNEGFKVIVHADTTIGSASRICTQGSYNKRTYPECEAFCEKNMVVRLSEIWSFRQDDYRKPTEEVKEMVPTYRVDGNVTYYKAPYADKIDEQSEIYDYIIYSANK